MDKDQARHYRHFDPHKLKATLWVLKELPEIITMVEIRRGTQQLE